LPVGTEPVVLVVTVRLPVVAVQLTEKVLVVVLPAVMLTVRGFEPLTVQFCATPASCTVWLPAASPVNVTLLLMPMAF
jgi:hypothetical protein